jgi:hypothetical protein
MLADIKHLKAWAKWSNLVIARAAKQSSFLLEESWIASSQALLAMTVRVRVPDRSGD